MKYLAIKGDIERGQEVIKLFESLGYYNCKNWKGNGLSSYYVGNSSNEIEYDSINYDSLSIYTLDKFYQTFPYKIGNKVLDIDLNVEVEIVDMEWCIDEECVKYKCKVNEEHFYDAVAEDLKPISNNKMNIAEILKNAPKGTKLYSPICGEVIFDSVNFKSLYTPICVLSSTGEVFYFTEDGKWNGEYYNTECLLFPSKENRNWSTFTIKPQFPSNIKDCNELIGIKTLSGERLYKCNELEALRSLLIARDAWWKIDDDWEPDWTDSDTDKWVIENYYNDIRVDAYTNSNYILSFRTKELAEMFFETFKPLIEQCQKLI